MAAHWFVHATGSLRIAESWDSGIGEVEETMSRSLRLITGSLLVVIALVLVACGGGAAPAPTSAPQASKPAAQPTAAQAAAPAQPTVAQAAAPATGNAAAKYTIRLASMYPADHFVSKAADKFAELVQQKTNGQVKVQVFHDAQLGSERETAEGLKSGTVEMMYSGLAGIGTYAPGIQVLELPYLYNDFDHLRRVAQQLTPDLTKLLTDKGIRPVGYYYDGPRSTLSVKPLRTIDDFKGLKFRVPESPAYVSMAKALGSIPTPIALPEAYNALQTKVAEAIEGSPSTLFNGKYYEVAKNLTLTKHIYQVLYLVANDKFYQGLPQDVQKAINDAGKESGDYQYQLITGINQQNYDKMKAGGAQIVEITDLTPFQQAVKDPNASFAKDKGEEAVQLLSRIQTIK